MTKITKAWIQKRIDKNRTTTDLVEMQKYDRHPVFVYGTLKKGQRLSHYLKRQTFVANGLTKAKFNLFSFYGGFPVLCLDGCIKGMQPEPKSERVKGELYLVSTDSLRTLDMVEGNGYMYQRTRLPVEFLETPVDVGNLRDKIGMHAYIYVGKYQYWNDRKDSIFPIDPIKMQNNTEFLQYTGAS